jgi:hypothetical protein
MSSQYKTRAHQILREIEGVLRRIPPDLNLRAAIRQAMWDCALIGALAERDRTLKILRAAGSGRLLERIIETPVKDVWNLTPDH